MLPLLEVAGADGGASVVGLDFDGTRAWPVYDWMGVAKAGPRVAHALPRQGARPEGDPGQPGRLGARSHGRGQVDPRIRAPSRTPGATGAARLGRPRRHTRRERAPIALLSDLLASTTGHVLHVDGGVHALGM